MLPSGVTSHDAPWILDIRCLCFCALSAAAPRERKLSSAGPILTEELATGSDPSAGYMQLSAWSVPLDWRKPDGESRQTHAANSIISSNMYHPGSLRCNGTASQHSLFVNGIQITLCA